MFRHIPIFFLLFAASTARAQEAPAPDLPPADPPSYHLTGGHLAGAYFAGLVSQAAFAVAGGLLGSALADDCEWDPGTQDCFLHGLHEMAAGVAIGMVLGSTTGVHEYARVTGHKGSYWWALTGSVITGVSFALAGVITEMEFLPAVGAVLMPVGAIVGYNYGSPAPNNTPRSGALIDLSPATGLRLGPPVLRWSRRGQDSRWSFSLLGGRF